MQLEINLEYFTNEISNIDSPIFDYSQIECLSYVAGYAVFSYLKLFPHCTDCQIFFTSPKDIEVDNDTGFSFIDLLDRGSLNIHQRVFLNLF